MFQVLRQANQRDGTCILESTSRPFEKRDQAQFVRPACPRCREKKVRCTGDKEGCQRCRDKSVQCSYADSSSSLPSTSPPALSSAVEAPSISRPAAPMSTPPATTTEQQSTAATTTKAKSTSTLSSSSIISTSSPLGTILATTVLESPSTIGLGMFEDSTTTYDFTHVEPDFVHDPSGPLLHDPFNSPKDTSMNSIYPPLSSFSDFLHEPLLNFPCTANAESVPRKASLPRRESGGQATRPDLEPNNYYFSHGLLQAFEAVEVCLVWTSRASTAGNPAPVLPGIDEMLTCHKDVLESCRVRLQCKAYRLRSHDAAILINICEKLLGSILRVKAVVESQRNHGLAQSTNRSRASSFLNSTAGTYSLVEQVTSQKQDSRYPQRGDASRNRINGLDGQALDLGLGEWRVDDEDKLYVLASLLSIRMMKLKHVVQELEEAVMSNRWLVHATMVKDLAGYISKCEAGILDS